MHVQVRTFSPTQLDKIPWFKHVKLTINMGQSFTHMDEKQHLHAVSLVEKQNMTNFVNTCA